jgi:hypothetical protein
LGGAQLAAAALGLVLALLTRTAGAWIEHEHEHVVLEAFARMLEEKPKEVSTLAEVWKTARETHPDVLCEGVIISARNGQEQRCIGFSMLAALAADHSCSPSDLSRTLAAGWLSGVLEVTRRTEDAIAEAHADKDRHAHLDAWRQAHLDFQHVDREYLTRAEGNNAHFQLPRQGEKLEIHLRTALWRSTESNAIANYVHYHAAALHLAASAQKKCAPGGGTCPRARAEAWRALAAEAFALHFLGDSFSAGHIVGTWGDGPTRMGSHDYYSENGVDARTWSGWSYAAYGDSFQRREDVVQAAIAITTSLTQLARVFEKGLAALDANDQHFLGKVTVDPDLDSCKAARVSHDLWQLQGARFVVEVVRDTPVPATRVPALPRFPNEVGVFYTPALDIAARLDFTEPVGDRIPLRARAAIAGIGFAASGISARNLDGLIYLRAPLLLDGSAPGASTAPRVGIGIEWHVPFFLLPLDLIPLAPIYLVDQATGGDLYFRIAARAAAGGAIARWQRIRNLSFLDGASWQIVLGREGTVAVYAKGSREQRGSVDAADAVGLDNHGYTQIQLPILAMTGKHIYAGDLALDSRFRLGYDVSFREGETIHGIWLGWGFEVRRYFWRP